MVLAIKHHFLSLITALASRQVVVKILCYRTKVHHLCMMVCVALHAWGTEKVRLITALTPSIAGLGVLSPTLCSSDTVATIASFRQTL